MAQYASPKKEKGGMLLLVILIFLVTLALSSLTVLVLIRARERNTTDKINYAIVQKDYYRDKTIAYAKQAQILQQTANGELQTDIEAVKKFIEKKQAEYANQDSAKSVGVVTLESFLRWVISDIAVSEGSAVIAQTDSKLAQSNEEHQNENLGEITEEYKRQVDDARDKINKLDDEIETIIGEFNRKESEKKEILKNIAKEKEEVEAKYEKQERDIKTEIKRLSELIRQNSIKKEPVTYFMENQGYILNPSRSARTAYINLGTEDNLVLGMKFKVYTEVKAGIIKWKGMVEVKKILEPHRSEVSITNQADTYEPIVEGDIIMNPLYDKKGARTIVLVGKFEEQNYTYYKYGLEEIKRRISGFNVKIADTVTVDTAFVIKGVKRDESQTDDQNTEMATLLAIPQLSIKDILEFLEY